jgi:hypothetical protein
MKELKEKEETQMEIQKREPQQDGIMTAPTGTVENRIQYAEETVKFNRAILRLIASNIQPNDIIVMGESLHFERGACEQILSWSGASTKIEKVVKENYNDDKGEYILFEIWGFVRLGNGRTLDVMGSCSTRDKFFGQKHDKDGGTIYKPLSEIDIANVKKKAITNWYNHAASRSVGLSSITIEMLSESGMDVSRLQRVEYGKGTKGGSMLSVEDNNRASEIATWLKEICNGIEEKARDELERMTTFKSREGEQVPGKRSTKKLTKKQIDRLYPKVKTMHDNYKKDKELIGGGDDVKSE